MYAWNVKNEHVLERHLSWLRRVTQRQATIGHRRDNIRRLGASLPVPLIDATPEHLDTWQANLTVSASSVHTYTSHARAFYHWLRTVERYRDDDPTEALPRPRLGRRLPRPIPEKDLKLAFRCAKGDLVVWLALAGWCGLRAGEIARLRGDDVREEDGRMYLHVDGKGGKERVVPVPDELKPMMRAATRRGRLFIRPMGGPATPQYVTVTVSRFMRGIGLPYTLHQLRHRFGTELYRISKDIRLTQEVMGHSDPRTTSGYVAIATVGTAKALNRLGRSLPLKKAS